MGKLRELAEASAAVELGRRHPYLFLWARVLKVLVPLLLIAAVLVGAGYGVSHIDEQWIPWILYGAATVAVAAVVAMLVPKLFPNLGWRLRIMLRRY